jgi:hypothetical protein
MITYKIIRNSLKYDIECNGELLYTAIKKQKWLIRETTLMLKRDNKNPVAIIIDDSFAFIQFTRKIMFPDEGLECKIKNTFGVLYFSYKGSSYSIKYSLLSRHDGFFLNNIKAGEFEILETNYSKASFTIESQSHELCFLFSLLQIANDNWAL